MLFDPNIKFTTHLHYSAFVLLIIFFSAGTKADPFIDEGLINEGSYTSYEIGWTMQIPEGWEIVTLNKAIETQNRGKETIEETVGQEVAIGEHLNLLHLQRDKSHTFQSTAETFISKHDGDWKRANEALKQLIINTYSDKGIRSDVSATKIEMIDEIKFEVYEFTLYAPDGKLFLRQIMYSSLINGYDFGVNFSYTDNQTRDEILSEWRKSKFVKKPGHPKVQEVQGPEVTDDEVKRAYIIYVESLSGNEYDVRHILVKEHEEAVAVLKRIKQGQSFTRVAADVSIDPRTKYKGGDLDWQRSESFPPEFSQAVVSLAPNGVTPEPIKTEFGWHIIEVRATREGLPPSFDQVKDEIEEAIRKKKASQHIDH
jgi:PPIC-type PPIASE domain